MEIPDKFYYLIGALVVSQFGTIIAMYKSKTEAAYRRGMRDAQVDAGIKDAKDTAVRAHKRDDVQDNDIKEIRALI